jgi:GTP-binding protein HflX
VVLVNVFEGLKSKAEAELAEMAELTESAGGSVVGSMVQRATEGRDFPGKGKLLELAALCLELKVQVVITRNNLSPAAARRMEDVLPCRVMDRTALILDIFAQRARSREGQLQVELAQILYLLPRLTGKGRELSQTAGGLRRGLGTRGPGEQKLEYDRRRMRSRVGRLKREIERLRERRGQMRRQRHDRSLPSVALAGYTNAGKSTLFNALSRASAVAESRMFSTLDPQVRLVRLPGGGRILMSDTVGFIQDLPEDLRIAFRATLEEIADADAILHVVDASHPEARGRITSVNNELNLLGAGSIPAITVLNKSDLFGPESSPALTAGIVPSNDPVPITVSAKNGTGLEKLKTALEDIMRASFWVRRVWTDPTPMLKTELARMGASVNERAVPDGSLEAWLTPAQAGAMPSLPSQRKKTA